MKIGQHPDYTTTCQTTDYYTDCLTVAASGVITDYTDVMVRGYLKEHTDFVTFRLDILQAVINAVRTQAAAEQLEWRRSDVSTGPPDPDREHHEQVAEYADHSCNCEWCLHGTTTDCHD